MEKGALRANFNDREPPVGKHAEVMNEVQGISPAPAAAQMFGGAAREYRWRYGTKRETFAKISVKARDHASRNPFAIFNKKLTVEEVLASDEVFDPLTRFQCCPPSCGAAAAVVCSERIAKKHGIDRAVYIAGQAMTTDYPSSFEPKSMIKMIGYDMAKKAAQAVYDQTGIGPEDVDVVELHDCFTANELLTYEAVGLCPEGGAEEFVGGATTPTAANTSRIRRAVCCPRGIPWGRQVWPNVPSWCGNCGDKLRPDRLKMPKLPSSTT